MSSNLNYKQVANVERRTWDVEAYEKKALQRQKNLEEQEQQPGKQRKSSDPLHSSATAAVKGEDGDKEEFRPAMAGAAGPEGSDRAFLKARSGKVADIDSRVGQVAMVSAEAAATTKSINTNDPSATDIKQGVVKTGIGWHCRVCDCFLKDSHTYLDHINGRKHQRKLGFSMRVKHSTKDDLVARLQSLSKEKKSGNALDNLEDEETDFNALVQAKDEELQRRRDERRKRRKERKKSKQLDDPTSNEESNITTENEGVSEKGSRDQQQTTDDQAAADSADEEPAMDPNLAAMMGFSGFGGSSKN